LKLKMTDLEEYIETLDRLVKAVRLTAYHTRECAARADEAADQCLVVALNIEIYIKKVKK